MDREETIKVLDYHLYSVPKPLSDAIASAIVLLKEQEAEIEQLNRFVNGFSRDAMPVVRCKDCDNKECWGRAGDVVCGIDGTPHRPDWFCADGERQEGAVNGK